jgi:photosystem I P700 chlorophyll a apoprotein A2
VVVYYWYALKPRFIFFFFSIRTAFLFAGWLHLQPKFQPGLSWFKNAESRLNHHLSGLFGFSSLAWTGHLVHVAIPEARVNTFVGIIS